MTSRLEELRGAPARRGDFDTPDDHRLRHQDEDEDDVEANYPDKESDQLMEGFHREAAAIQNVLRWATKNVQELQASFSDRSATASPAALHATGQQLDAIEQKLAAVRSRLRRIAAENKQFKQDHAHRTAVIRTRIVQYKQMGERFIDITRDIEALRLKHRDALTRSVKEDVKRANPAISDAQVDAAMAGGDRALESVLISGRNTADLRYQVADIKARNAEIQKLTQSLVELQTMFTDMSILVEGQQELINTVEYNVQETKTTAKATVVELEEAHRYQKKKNKKKRLICCIIFVAVLIAAAIIIFFVGKSLGWFHISGRSSSSSSTNPLPTANKTREITSSDLYAGAVSLKSAPRLSTRHSSPPK